jgi:hypothetical protein
MQNSELQVNGLDRPNADRHEWQLQESQRRDASCKVSLRKMERMAVQYRDLANLDRAVPRDKHSVATILGVRP